MVGKKRVPLTSLPVDLLRIPLILLRYASKGSKLKCMDLQFVSRGKEAANFRRMQ